MYTNGSEEFNRIIETPNNKAIQKRLVLEDTGGVIDKFKTLIMYSSSNSQELQIGTTNMSYLDVEAFTDIAIFDGQKLRLECGVELSDGSIEYAPMGVFTAVNTEKGLNSVKFTANDNMQKIEKLYTSSLTYPTTSDKIISEICEICEIELATPIENPITVAEKLQGYTCREVLGFIAGIHGKFACFDRLGQLNLRWYSEMPIEKQNSLIWSFTKSQEPFVVDKIEIAKNTETKFTSGEGNNTIYHSNPFATQQITDNILDDLRGFSYSTSKIEMLDDIRLDIWDMIKITYLDGNEYFIPCMSIRQNMGASSTHIESFSKSKTQNQYRYEGATTQFLNRMATELLITNRVVASKVDADYVQSHAITTDNLEAIKADIKYAVIDDLNADFITTEELEAESAVIKVAVVQELSAEFGDIKQLKSDVAKIDTLIFGTASGDVIQTTFANSVIAQLGDVQIKSAMIQDVSASKITAGTIYTDDVTIQSQNGQMMLKDNTIQISDGTRARVQIGKDASNDYSINVWDKSGNLMFSQGGITDKAIKSAIIRNDMVSENANIHAGKLDINSLFTEINGSSNTIKANKIYLDEEEQNLEVSFKSMNTTITDINDQMIVDNLIPYPYFETTHEQEGITFTDNGDGTVTVNGTSTGYAVYHFNGESTLIMLPVGTYTLSGCVAGGGGTKYKVQVQKKVDGTDTQITFDAGKGVTFEITEPTYVIIRIMIYPGFTFSNAIFRPMLEKGNIAHSYQQYELSRYSLKQTITSQGTLLEVVNGQISSKIWEQDITTAINDINVGGTNLLPDTNVNTLAAVSGIASRYWSDATRTDITCEFIELTDPPVKGLKYGVRQSCTAITDGGRNLTWRALEKIEMEDGEDYTLSVYARVVSSDSATLRFRFHGNGYQSTSITITNTEWKRVSVTIKVDKSNFTDDGYCNISCGGLVGTTISTVELCGFKLEKGNKATDWTPAPQDTDTSITTLSTKYSTLEQDVDSFKTTVSATYSTKAELQTTKSDLEQNLDGFKTTVSETYTTLDKFNSLEIGGRNILRGTYIKSLSSENSWEAGGFKATSGGNGVASVESISDSPVKSIDYAVQITGNTSGNRDITQTGIPYIPGEQYTFSIWVKGTGTLLVRSWNSTTGAQDASIYKRAVSFEKWTRVIATFFSGSAEGKKTIQFGVTGACDTIMFLAPKIEKGNKATDWTPAPEDTDAVITSVQTIATQTANKFNWLVKSGTSATDFTLTDRMAELTAKIISLNGNVKVNGAMIVDDAITADKIDTTDLFAQNITVNGTFKANGSAWISPVKEDLDLLRKFINGEITLTTAQKTAFDFDVNGKVDLFDFAICKSSILHDLDILSKYPSYNPVNSNVNVTINPKNTKKIIEITATNSFGRNIDVFFGMDGIKVPSVDTGLVNCYTIQSQDDVIANYGTDNEIKLSELYGLNNMLKILANKTVTAASDGTITLTFDNTYAKKISRMGILLVQINDATNTHYGFTAVPYLNNAGSWGVSGDNMFNLYAETGGIASVKVTRSSTASKQTTIKITPNVSATYASKTVNVRVFCLSLGVE